MKCKNCGIKMKFYTYNRTGKDECTHSSEVSDEVRSIMQDIEIRTLSDLVGELRSITDDLMRVRGYR